MYIIKYTVYDYVPGFHRVETGLGSIYIQIWVKVNFSGHMGIQDDQVKVPSDIEILVTALLEILPKLKAEL